MKPSATRVVARRLATDIGDTEFPLDVDLESVIRTHPDVGERARVTQAANEVLEPLRGKVGKITGVFLKNGQIAGYEAEIEGKRFYAPKKDFYIRRQMVEDVYVGSALATSIRKGMSHWNSQHDYYGPSWSGVEQFHYDLAKITHTAAVEVPSPGPWYRYPTSTRPDMDGKDWRLVIPDRSGAVCVNCHSILHDHVWTLATTIYSTQEVAQNTLDLIGHPDHWARTLLWTLRVAVALATQGYDYAGVIEDLRWRIRMIPTLWEYRDELMPLVARALLKVTGEDLQMLPVSIGLSKIRIWPESIAVFSLPTDKAPYSMVTINPSAGHNLPYLYEIIKHELIHCALKNLDGKKRGHSKAFQQMAELLGLPAEYRD